MVKCGKKAKSTVCMSEDIFQLYVKIEGILTVIRKSIKRQN